MSLKLYSLQLFGKLKPVEKIEVQRQILADDYQEFLKVEQSEELKQFLHLEKEVLSPEFKKRKAEIQALKFKGSKEDALLKEYEKLKKDARVKKFFKLKDSADLKRFETLKDSEKLNEFRRLTEFVENGTYREEKEISRRQVFKGSDEEQQEREYIKLKKSKGIQIYYELHQSEILTGHEAVAHSEKLKKFLELKNLPEQDKGKKKELQKLKNDVDIKSYLKFEHSKKLRIYLDMVGSYNLKQFEELKAVVESDDFKKRVAFLKDKKKFEKTNTFKKYNRFKELKNSDDIKFYHKFEKSPLLKNYYDVKDSAELKRYFEFKDIVTSEEFVGRKAYLEDSKKWEKSEEYASEQKYHEMKTRPHLIKYFRYKESDAFDFFRKWEVAFEDRFSGEKLDVQKWSAQPLWAQKTLGKNYAMPGDLHINTEGKNIVTGDKLVIETRKEKTEGMVWNMPAGFVHTEFDYTSGFVSSSNGFWFEDGIVEAKIKFNPVKETVSSFSLTGEKSSPGVYLLEMGLKNRVGVATIDDGGKLKMNGLDISSLKKGKWYIFTLKKSGGNFIWKINETEVFRTEQRHIDFPLHINLQSIVVNPIPGSKLPVRFQTEWVRCYKVKS